MTNIYAVDIHFTGVVRTKNVKEFKSGLLKCLGSSIYCKRKVTGTGFKLNLNENDIKKILKQQGVL